MSLSRRAFLTAAAISAVMTPVRLHSQQDSGFTHGVASGDPLSDGIVIWTRIAPRPGARSTAVRWRVMTDGATPIVVRTGTASTTAERDHTVKIDVRGLEPGHVYRYQFEADGRQSPEGRTKTLPRTADRVRLAVVSCSNYPAGFFNGYAAIAARNDVDAVLHLGDYIYEFANGTFGDGTAIGRVPQPEHEALTLDDYRQRYATYRRDPDLQELHRCAAFIPIWDDHEFADNAWAGGPDGWAARRAAAIQAYLEWMPVREPRRTQSFHLYRSFAFGNLATLCMLDTRSGRDGQVNVTDDRGIRDPRRRVLGAAQERWLSDTLQAARRSGTTWSLVGQQVMFSPFTPPAAAVKNPDSWDGYQAERARLRELFASVGNAAILTGDVHSSWAFDVPIDPWNGYRADTGDGSHAVELITPAISSEPYFTGDQKATLEPGIRSALPHLKYLDGEHRGYLLLDLTPARLTASWFVTPDVSRRSPLAELAATRVVEAGAMRLQTG